jgi:O-antigen/teichoic acid export membrane protein
MSLAPSIFFSLLTLVNQAAMQAVLNFVGVVIPNFTSSITKFALGVLFVTIGWSVGGAMVAYIIGSTLSYLSSIRLAKEFIKKKKNSSDLKPILKYAFPVLVQALAFTSILSMDVILVKHFLPSHEAGVYSALSTLGRIIYFALYPVTTVMFPIVSGRRSRGEKYRNIFYIAFFVTFSVSICIVGFYYFFPELAIRNLYGQSYLGAEKELVWMGIFMMFYTLSYLLVNFLLSIGRTKIVIFPLIVSIAQVVAIWIMHDTIFQVIKASIMVTAPLFVSLSLYMGYNQIQRIYAKK